MLSERLLSVQSMTDNHLPKGWQAGDRRRAGGDDFILQTSVSFLARIRAISDAILMAATKLVSLATSDPAMSRAVP